MLAGDLGLRENRVEYAEERICRTPSGSDGRHLEQRAGGEIRELPDVGWQEVDIGNDFLFGDGENSGANER